MKGGKDVKNTRVCCGRVDTGSKKYVRVLEKGGKGSGKEMIWGRRIRKIMWGGRGQEGLGGRK